MQMTKKITSIVLAVLMVVSMMSVMAVSTASAATYVAKIGSTKYKTLEAAFAAANDGDKITLLADCAGNGIKVTPAGKFTTGLTVDFDGHTYTVDGETVGSSGTETNGFQLLKNNKVTFENGTITSAKAKILVQNYSDLTLNKMTLTLNNSSYSSAYTLSNNNGNTVIKDSTINANPAGGYAFDVCRFSSYPSVSVTVTGDDSVINGNVEISASNSDLKDGLSLNFESGKMTGTVVVDASAQAASAADTSGKYSITNNSTPVTPVAKIGDTGYATLADAFAAAQDGNTITVLADSTGNGIKVPQGKFSTNGLTVDFNGFEYVVDANTVGSTGTETNGFQLLKNNKITFKNGSINSGVAKILVQNYSDLTLEKMELSMYNADYSSAYTLSNNNGNVVIDSSAISANTGGGFAFDVCRYANYTSVNVTVKGDSVIDGNVEVFASNSDPKDGFSLTLESGTMTGDIVVDATAKTAMAADPDKAEVTKKNTFTKEAPADYKWVDNNDGTSSLVAKKYVAQVGSTKYESLEEALAAISTVTSEYHSKSDLTIKKYKANGEIKLLANCEGNGIAISSGSNLTIDFDGHTYNVNGDLVGSNGTESNGFQLLKDSDVTFKNGTITSAKAQMIIQNYSNLTLDNMTIDGTHMAGDGNYVLSNNNGNVVINDTKINAKDGRIAFDVCRYASYPSVNVTVKGDSVIDGNVEVYASNSNPMNGFSLTLESGTMTGDIILDKTAQNVIDATPEKAEVTKKNTFSQEAPLGYEWVDNGDGTSSIAPATTNPLDALMDKVADGNQFGINSQYLAGTLLGVQKKEAIDDADVTSESRQESGNDIRFVAVLDTEILQGADDYGFVLAKANSKNAYSGVNFDNLKAHFGNGEKTVSALNTYNTVCGTTEAAQKYGDPTDDTTDYKYITCAVNGMSDEDMVVARFYVVKDGKTYYAKYAGHDYKYTGCMTKADLAPVAD